LNDSRGRSRRLEAEEPDVRADAPPVGRRQNLRIRESALNPPGLSHLSGRRPDLEIPRGERLPQNLLAVKK
jgi:hypothetical protein